MGSTLVGSWDGWPFQAALRSGRRETMRARFRLARGPAAHEVRGTIMPAGCRLSLGKGELRLTCSTREEDLPDLFREGMDAAVSLLCACSAALPAACALCGQKGGDSFALVKGHYTSVHRDCCEDHCRRVEDRAALTARGGSYLTGWLGALAGGLAGLLPTLLTAGLWDMVNVWLCLCIPLGAYFGYKLCRGRMDRMAVAATVVSSLVQIFLLDQARYYLDFVAQGIFPLVFASTAHYFNHVPLKEMLLRVAEPLQFVTLADVCALCIIDVGHWDRTLEADAMLDSLTQRPARESRSVPAEAQRAETAARPGEEDRPVPAAAEQEPAGPQERPAEEPAAEAEVEKPAPPVPAGAGLSGTPEQT